jgi:cobalamin biosynthesis Mg chelatase CobN
MIETIRKGNWKADAETEKTLLTEYLESVEQHGVDCVEYTCGNPRLSKFIMERGKITGIPAATLQQYQAAIERATGATLATAAAEAETFAQRNDARINAEMNQARVAKVSAPAPPAASQPPPDLKGYVMEARDLSQAPSAASAAVPQGGSDRLGMTMVGGAMLGLLLAWRWRVQHRQTH